MFRNVTAMIVAICFPALASALEVTLKTEGASGSFRGLLNDASLVRAIDPETEPAVQDYIAAARADYRRLLTALYAAGFYGGTVSIKIDGVEAATLHPLAAPNTIQNIIITVDSGPVFTFGRTDIAPLAPATLLPESFATGQRARSDVIQRGVSAGLNAWRDAGYAKARTARQQITARHNDSQLDVSVTLAPGPQLTFGNLTISGNKDVRIERISEIAGLPVGEVYSPEQLTKSERRLRRAGAFDSIALTESETVGLNNTLPIIAQVVESKPHRFGFGLELSSIEGLRVSSFWLHRNLLGGAERLRIDGEVAGIDGVTGGTDYTIGASFNRPATFGPDTDLYFLGELTRQDEPDYLLDKFSIEVGLSRMVNDELTVEAGVGLLTAREESDLGTREYTLLTLPLKATLDRRDEPTNANAGYFINVTATPFISLDGGTNGARLYNDTRAYRSFGENDRFTLAARGQIGSLFGATTDNAPADFLYYSGGGGTVRGQPYKSLGIDRIEGTETVTTGGTSFTGAQLEARVDVTDKIGIVGFYDIGHVGDSSIPLEDGDWHAGAGIGVRYNTGIGPIRLDLATQASGTNAGESLQVYIGIGQAF